MTYNKDELLKMFEESLLNKDEDFYEELNNDLLSTLNLIFDDFDVDNGASKLAIIPVKEDYVIKIPYTGTTQTDCCFSYSEDEDEDGYYEEDYFSPFVGAGKDAPWDYCALEVERYQYAKKFGVERFLAETKLLGYVHGYPIYIQEKCETYYDSQRFSHHSIYSEEEKKTTRSMAGLGQFEYLVNENWLTDFRFYYGREALVDFVDFLLTNNWGDLNTSNIGYLNGRPVIFDYSGYDS